MCSSNEKSKVGFSEMEIDEWNLELRMNNISMDEHNVGVRKENLENKMKLDIDMTEKGLMKKGKGQTKRKKDQI